MMTPAAWTEHQLALVGAENDLGKLEPQAEYVIRRMLMIMEGAKVLADAAVGCGERSTELLEATLAELRRYVTAVSTRKPFGGPAQQETAAALRLLWPPILARFVEEPPPEALVESLVALGVEPLRAVATMLPLFVAMFEERLQARVAAQLELRQRMRRSKQRRRAILAGL